MLHRNIQRIHSAAFLTGAVLLLPATDSLIASEPYSRSPFRRTYSAQKPYFRHSSGRELSNQRTSPYRRDPNRSRSSAYYSYALPYRYPYRPLSGYGYGYYRPRYYGYSLYHAYRYPWYYGYGYGMSGGAYYGLRWGVAPAPGLTGGYVYSDVECLPPQFRDWHGHAPF